MRALTMREMEWVVGGQSAPPSGGSTGGNTGGSQGGGNQGSGPQPGANDVPDVGERIGEAYDNPGKTLGGMFDWFVEMVADGAHDLATNGPGVSPGGTPQQPQPPTGPYSQP